MTVRPSTRPLSPGMHERHSRHAQRNRSLGSLLPDSHQTAPPADASSAAVPPPRRPPSSARPSLPPVARKRRRRRSRRRHPARCASRTGPRTWPPTSSRGSRTKRASPSITKRTSTTTRSGSPRSRSRCAQAGHRRGPRGADHLHGRPPAAARLPERVEPRQHPEHQQPAARSAGSQRRPGPQVQRALHVRLRRHRLQQGGDRQGHQEHRRSVGSRLQGPGQPVLRHPGRTWE